jgi:DNA-binding transcriptional LysR family regulator
MLCENARMDWQDLRYFLALARTGSLSAAARELGVDHATVSRRVAAFEKALGVRLIHRLPRRAELTQDGRAVAALGTDVEAQVQRIERRVRGTALSLIATVRVSAPPAIAARLIVPHVAAFLRINPGVTIMLSGRSNMVALDRGEADVAVRLIRPEDPHLLVSRIGRAPFGLYGTPALASLPSQKWRFVAYDESLEHLPQQKWLKSFAADRPIVFRASDLFGQLEAVRTGVGGAVLPHFMAELEPTLVLLPSGSTPPTREIWLATYPDLKRSAAVRLVMDFLTETIGRSCPSREVSKR